MHRQRWILPNGARGLQRSGGQRAGAGVELSNEDRADQRFANSLSLLLRKEYVQPLRCSVARALLRNEWSGFALDIEAKEIERLVKNWRHVRCDVDVGRRAARCRYPGGTAEGFLSTPHSKGDGSVLDAASDRLQSDV